MNYYDIAIFADYDEYDYETCECDANDWPRTDIACLIPEDEPVVTMVVADDDLPF